MLSHDQFHAVIQKVAVEQDEQSHKEAEALLDGEIDCAVRAAILVATNIAQAVEQVDGANDAQKGEMAVVNLFTTAFVAGYIGAREQILAELDAGEAAIKELVEPPSDLPGNYM